MDLFESVTGEPGNLLPKDGTVLYYGPIMSLSEAQAYFDDLFRTIAWQHDEAVMFGRKLVTKRKVAWYGDAAFDYSYSNTTKQALPWTKTLLDLKHIVEQKTGDSYNSCLLNLYHDGSEGMAWHSDDEKELKKNAPISSLSFGAERKFAFKHKNSKETLSLMLASGSLLAMKDTTQHYWLHRLPTTKKVDQPRINLTFRTMNTASD